MRGSHLWLPGHPVSFKVNWIKELSQKNNNFLTECMHTWWIDSQSLQTCFFDFNRTNRAVPVVGILANTDWRPANFSKLNSSTGVFQGLFLNFSMFFVISQTNKNNRLTKIRNKINKSVFTASANIWDRDLAKIVNSIVKSSILDAAVWQLSAASDHSADMLAWWQEPDKCSWCSW